MSSCDIYFAAKFCVSWFTLNCGPGIFPWVSDAREILPSLRPASTSQISSPACADIQYHQYIVTHLNINNLIKHKMFRRINDAPDKRYLLQRKQGCLHMRPHSDIWLPISTLLRQSLRTHEGLDCLLASLSLLYFRALNR